MLGWLSHSDDRPDVKINVIYPATDVHIRKVIPPRSMITTRTGVLNNSLFFSFLFVTVLQPAGPHCSRNARVIRTHRKAVHRRLPSVAHPMVGLARPSSLACSAVSSIAHRFERFHKYRVDEIISGRSEAEKVLFRSPPEADPFGFLILPDMKWDLADLASLYLVALTLLPNIKSLRDLNLSHLPLLRSIRREATNVVKSRWGLERSELRLFIHYQPSYCKLRSSLIPSSKKICPLQ
jgi:hypothetical protein